MAKMNWDRAKQRESAGGRAPAVFKSSAPRGPTGAQMRYLAALARKHGIPTPRPKTRARARLLIDELKRR